MLTPGTEGPVIETLTPTEGCQPGIQRRPTHMIVGGNAHDNETRPHRIMTDFLSDQPSEHENADRVAVVCPNCGHAYRVARRLVGRRQADLALLERAW